MFLQCDAMYSNFFILFACRLFYGDLNMIKKYIWEGFFHFVVVFYLYIKDTKWRVIVARKAAHEYCYLVHSWIICNCIEPVRRARRSIYQRGKIIHSWKKTRIYPYKTVYTFMFGAWMMKHSDMDIESNVTALTESTGIAFRSW